jgi:hypothetical protein
MLALVVIALVVMMTSNDLTANSKGLGMACRCEKNVATKGE